MRTATKDRTTPEATAEVMALLALASTGRTPENLVRIHGVWIDRPVTSAADRQLARDMADYRAQAVLDNFGEVDVPDGSDARCCVCTHPLAGLTGYYDKRDAHPRPLLCVDDYEIEMKAAKGILR